MASVNGNGLAAKAWLRALEFTAPIARNRDSVMSTVIEELAAGRGDMPAFLSNRECMIYQVFCTRVNQYAGWALDAGIAKGEVACFLMSNRPEYLVIWLDITSIGDTFHWKGENVATSEVSEAICAFLRVKHANVYGVAVPATEGRTGIAAVVAEHPLDLAGFRKHLVSRLPPYARPLFLRIRNEVEVTGTSKCSKTDVVRQGYDPIASNDVLYFDNLESEAYTPLDKDLYDRIQVGSIHL